MKNLMKRTISLMLIICMMIGGTNFVFADQLEKHYYDRLIDSDGTWRNSWTLGDSYVYIEGSVEETLLKGYDEKVNLFGSLVYGTGYEIVPPIINYRAGGSTVGEVEYFKDGALAVVRVDYVKRKKDRFEAIMKEVPVDSGQDDESVALPLKNAGEEFSPVVYYNIEKTNHKGLKKSTAFLDKKATLSEVCQYEKWFDGEDWTLNMDNTKVINNKVNWYNWLEKSTFSDVADNSWYARAVIKCRSLGLVSGVGDNKYNPNGTLTKAQVAQVIYNIYCKEKQIESEKANINVKDVQNNKWYAESVKWAVQNKIVDLDTNGEFHPDSPASRIFTALTFFNFFQNKNIGMPNWEGYTLEDGFPDMKDRSLKEQKAVIALQNAQIISGYPGGYFGPDDKLTRAQLAVILDNFIYAKTKVESGMYEAETY